MNEVSDATKQLLNALKTERDDLKVRMHLAAMDLKEELSEDWQNLEHKWAELTANAKRLGHDVEVVTEALGDDFEDIADDFGDMGESIMKDIRAGYSRIREKLSSDD